MPITYDQTAGRGNLGQHYQPFKDGDLEGLSRVPRASGSGRWGRRANPLHEARVASAAELIADMLLGRAPSWALKEAIRPSHQSTARAIESNYPGLFRLQETYTVSDFPNLMGDVLDRMLLDRFREFPQGWRRYIRVSRPLNDFRTVRRLALNGAEGQYSKVADSEGFDYSTTLAEENYTYAPDLYALGVRLSFRSIMNDDLDAFDMIPDRLGRGGRRTVARAATELLYDASGPDATLFSSGNSNLLSGNPDFAIDSLGAAFEKLLGFTDDDSEPILVEGVVLEYPPALHVTVQNLLNQLSVDLTAEGGVSGQTVRVNNWIVRDLEAVLNPYIPIVCSTSNGNTSWALHSRPTSGRPIAEIGFLRGFEEPQLYRKAPNSQRVSGGLDEMVGDFETMDQIYKGVIAFGGSALEPQASVASNGSNS